MVPLLSSADLGQCCTSLCERPESQARPRPSPPVSPPPLPTPMPVMSCPGRLWFWWPVMCSLPQFPIVRQKVSCLWCFSSREPYLGETSFKCGNWNGSLRKETAAWVNIMIYILQQIPAGGGEGWLEYMSGGRLSRAVSQAKRIWMRTCHFYYCFPSINDIYFYVVLPARHMAVIEVAGRRYLDTNSVFLEEKCSPWCC